MSGRTSPTDPTYNTNGPVPLATGDRAGKASRCPANIARSRRSCGVPNSERPRREGRHGGLRALPCQARRGHLRPAPGRRRAPRLAPHPRRLLVLRRLHHRRRRQAVNGWWCVLPGCACCCARSPRRPLRRVSGPRCRGASPCASTARAARPARRLVTSRTRSRCASGVMRWWSRGVRSGTGWAGCCMSRTRPRRGGRCCGGGVRGSWMAGVGCMWRLLSRCRRRVWWGGLKP